MDLGMMYSLKLVIFLTLFFVLMNFVNLYLNVDMKQMKKPKKKKRNEINIVTNCKCEGSHKHRKK